MCSSDLGEEHEAGMVDVASMAGMREEDDSEVMVPVIGTAAGTMSREGVRASMGVAAEAEAVR